MFPFWGFEASTFSLEIKAHIECVGPLQKKLPLRV